MSARLVIRQWHQMRRINQFVNIKFPLSPVNVQQRLISCTPCKHCAADVDDEPKRVGKTNPEFDGKKGQQVREVDVHTSIKYLHSNAYRVAYGDDPVWKPYRRNVKGHFMPPPRETCIRAGIIATGSACPICRDDFLVFDYRNTELLKQFIGPVNFEPLNPKVTGLCKKQFKQLKFAVAKAQDYGLLAKYVGARQYNYEHYMNRLSVSKSDDMDNTAESQTS